MRNLIETICGCCQLARLALKSRFRMRNAYWRWRRETAFGTDETKMPSRAARIRAIIEYGRWVHRMRRRL
jgi:hypothetical protein